MLKGSSKIFRFALTLGVVTLATYLRFLLIPVLGEGVPFILFFPTVVICSWYGGLWQGIFSALLGGLIAWYVFIPPEFSLQVSEPYAPGQLVVFLFAATLISFLAESLHRSRRKVEQSEKREREEHERFLVTLSSIGDAVIATDEEGRVNFINHIAERLTGWSQAEALGKPLEMIFRILNEETRNPVENPALRAMKEGIIFGLANHAVLLRKDGVEIPIDDSGAPIKDSNGDIIGAVLIFRDITQRRKAEQNRAHLAAIIETSEDAIISKNLDGIITSWNISAERIFGYTAAEAIGRSITMIIPPDRLEEETEILTRLRCGQRIEHYETVRLSKSGDTLDISLSVSPLMNRSGEIIGASKILRDISQRKQAEEELNRQREWLRVTLTSIGDGVIATDINGAVTFLNPVAEILTGWKQEECQGMSLQEVFRIVSEHSRIIMDNPALLALKEDRIVGLANDTLLIARNGSEIPIADSGAPIKDPGGKLVGAVLVFRDISEGRSAQRKFQLVVESTPTSIVMVNADGQIVLVNSETERLFGYKRDELIGHPIEKLIPENYRAHHPFYRKQFSAKPEKRPMGMGRDLFGLGKDGREIPVEIGLNPIIVNNELLVLCSIFDITARKQAEEQRLQLLEREREARTLAESANRMKDEFLATVSHELRTPLNAILGWAELLKTGELDESGRTRAAEVIENSIRTEARLVEDLLDTSRITSGTIQLQFDRVDLRAVLQKAIDTVRPAANAKSIRLHTKFLPTISLVVGDATRLQQVAVNLISNAVKFTPDGGHVQIVLDSSDSHARITVADNGIGINAEFLPYVFQRFRQNADARVYGGLGLGLAIVRQLVEMHSGTVHAHSDGEGTGATFTVQLPLHQAELI